MLVDQRPPPRAPFLASADDLQLGPHLGQARAQLLAHQAFVVGEHGTVDVLKGCRSCRRVGGAGGGEVSGHRSGTRRRATPATAASRAAGSGDSSTAATQHRHHDQRQRDRHQGDQRHQPERRRRASTATSRATASTSAAPTYTGCTQPGRSSGRATAAVDADSPSTRRFDVIERMKAPEREHAGDDQQPPRTAPPASISSSRMRAARFMPWPRQAFHASAPAVRCTAR